MTKNKTSSLVTIASFLVFELLAFAAFSLANSIFLYAVVGFAVFALLFLGTSLQLKNKGFTDFAIFVIPCVLYGVLLLISPFSANFDAMTYIFVIIATVSFSAVGAYMRANKEFKLSTAFIVIYGALAALVLISFGWNMIQFEPFYTIKYANAYSYYDGQISSVSIGNMAYFLIGFQFQKVSVEYFSLFPSLLTTSVIALFFLKPKENKKISLVYLLYTIIGFLPLILMPNKLVLITDVALLILYTLIYSFLFFVKNKVKTGKIFLIVLGSLIGFGVLFLILNANVSIGFIQNNPLLNRIFNTNRLAAPIRHIFGTVLSGGQIFGYEPYSISYDYISSSSFIFDNFMMSGLFGGLLIIFIIAWGARSLYQMCVKSNISLQNKTLICAFVIAFFGYSLINYDMQPYVLYSNYIPFFLSGPFFVVLFLIGYSFKLKIATEKEEQVENSEDNLEEKEINI